MIGACGQHKYKLLGLNWIGAVFLFIVLHSLSTHQSATMSAPSTAEELLAIEVRGLTFTYTQGAESSPIKPEQTLEDIDLLLAKGARCLLIGANGCESTLFLGFSLGLILLVAGKSTLLRILAGKKLTKTKTAKILGQDVFMNPPRVSPPLIPQTVSRIPRHRMGKQPRHQV
jgi:ABC-type glutathione transport system ATPase component